MSSFLDTTHLACETQAVMFKKHLDPEVKRGTQCE